MAFGKKDRPTVDKDGAALVMRKRDYLADFSGQLGLGLMANLVGSAAILLHRQSRDCGRLRWHCHGHR